MIIDVFSCMYVRRVRAHVTHVTRDSVNGKVRKMIIEGVSDAERKRKKEKNFHLRRQMEISENHFSRILYLVAYTFLFIQLRVLTYYDNVIYYV